MHAKYEILTIFVLWDPDVIEMRKTILFQSTYATTSVLDSGMDFGRKKALDLLKKTLDND